MFTLSLRAIFAKQSRNDMSGYIVFDVRSRDMAHLAITLGNNLLTNTECHEKAGQFAAGISFYYIPFSDTGVSSAPKRYNSLQMALKPAWQPGW
jgi:hypothetical protein